MVECDVLIVGGGPAGSTCARALRAAGWNVVVMDRARFPRDKVCAGWVTPGVFDLLDLDPDEYRRTGLTIQAITGFSTRVFGGPAVETRYRAIVSHAIRRCEFDDFLLRRADVTLLQGSPLSTLRRERDAWIANDQLRAPIVVGAAGHFCPVARHLRRNIVTPQPVVAREAEFRLNGRQSSVASEMPELFFCRDLMGYGWCVRKGEYVNVGLGRRDARQFSRHVDELVDFLERSGRAPGASAARWRGHAYSASGKGSEPLVADGLMLVGDAAGLAYPESGEGIRPAIESGLLAAQALVAAGGRHRADDLRAYEARLRALHPAARPSSGRLGDAATVIGRLLMRSRAFTRHVVLDRWFLRRAGPGLAGPA